MAAPTLVPDPAHLRLEALCGDDRGIIVVAAAREDGAACPLCGGRAARVHSRYVRHLADLPWHGVAVRLRLRVRRFFCDIPECARRIFAERLPAVAAPFARRTLRLCEAWEAVGFALGGEAGARVLRELGMATSPDTLLRLLRRAAAPEVPAPKAVGVDDWALRKGRAYGTIVVDLERRRVLDLLPDRGAAGVAAWLAAHPQVEVVSRDRWDAFAEGVRRGAPQATQVLDRFHVIRNLAVAAERLCARHHAGLREAAGPQEQPGAGAHTAPPLRAPAARQARDDSEARSARRVGRWEEARRLHAAGLSITAIAARLDLDRKTVRGWVRADRPPERAAAPRRPSQLDPHAAYLEGRWRAGCRNVRLLGEELRARGYTGSISHLRHCLGRWRTPSAAAEELGGGAGGPHAAGPRTLSPRRAAWLLLRWPEDLDGRDRDALAALREACPDLAAAYPLAQRFRRLLRDGDVAALGPWLSAAEGSGVPELASFARGLRPDLPALEAAVRLPYSNGPVEGQVNRLKLLKRQMFGRAKLDLLRARLLHAG